MDKKEVGFTGETIACGYLEKKGYRIIARNYRTKFGEIDIIAKSPEKILVFFEVKTLLMNNNHPDSNKLSYPQISDNVVNNRWIIRQLSYLKNIVLKPYYKILGKKSGNKAAMKILPDIDRNDRFLPEDQISHSKMRRFKRISLWYANLNPSLTKDNGFRLDVIAIEMKDKDHYTIRHYENIT